MAQAQGSSVSLRMGKETSYGVTGTSSFEIPFAPTLDIKESQNLNDSSVIRGKRSADRSFLGFKSVDGSVSIPLDTKTAPKFLEGFLGVPVSVDNGNGTFTHKFKVSDVSVPSYFVEVAHIDIGLFYLYNGIKMNNFDLSFGGDGELLMNVSMLGQKSTKSTTEVIAPTVMTNNLKYSQFQASIVGASNVKDFKLNYTNNLDGNQYVIGDGGVRGEIPLGMVGVSGSFTALYEDDALLADARNNVDKALKISLANGVNTIDFDMREVVLEPTGVPIDSPQGLTQTFNYTSFWRADADASSLIVSVTNDSATV